MARKARKTKSGQGSRAKRTSNRRGKRAIRIEDAIARIARRIPKEEWDKIPSDLSYNLDHYLYGAPKK